MEEEFLMPPIDWAEGKSSIIKVIGVGGGGGNAVNYMYRQGIHNVSFAVCNTDWQDLKKSPVPVKVKIGELGAGGDPQVGREAAKDHLDMIRELLEDGTKMVFVTAGMGGGTGTGATPVIAQIARELGILTVAIVTIPFRTEGDKRFKQAIEGVNQLKDHVDSLLVINNDKLIEMYGNLSITESFAMADNVLNMAAKGIAELITRTGTINLDFADVSSIMTGGGFSVIGSASYSGENRAREAVQAALTSPLLNNNDITGARRILLNITTGGGKYDLLTSELGEITDYVKRVAKDASMIWGTGIDENLGESVSVTVVATDFSDHECIDPIIADVPTREKIFVNPDNNGEKFTPVINDGGYEVRPRAPQPERKETGWKKPAAHVKTQTETADGVDVDVMVMEKEDIQDVQVEKQRILSVPIISDKQYSIDELESEPAYKRRNIKLDSNATATEKEMSKYTLSSDRESTVRLRDNNAYLYNRAD